MNGQGFIVTWTLRSIKKKRLILFDGIVELTSCLNLQVDVEEKYQNYPLR